MQRCVVCAPPCQRLGVLQASRGFRLRQPLLRLMVIPVRDSDSGDGENVLDVLEKRDVPGAVLAPGSLY